MISFLILTFSFEIFWPSIAALLGSKFITGVFYLVTTIRLGTSKKVKKKRRCEIRHKQSTSGPLHSAEQRRCNLSSGAGRGMCWKNIYER